MNLNRVYTYDLLAPAWHDLLAPQYRSTIRTCILTSDSMNFDWHNGIFENVDLTWQKSEIFWIEPTFIFTNRVTKYKYNLSVGQTNWVDILYHVNQPYVFVKSSGTGSRNIDAPFPRPHTGWGTTEICVRKQEQKWQWSVRFLKQNVHKTVAWLHVGWWDGQNLTQWSRVRKAY